MIFGCIRSPVLELSNQEASYRAPNSGHPNRFGNDTGSGPPPENQDSDPAMNKIIVFQRLNKKSALGMCSHSRRGSDERP